jgi:hypothetical protein
MNNTPPPSSKAAAIWYLWASSFSMAMAYAPRWSNDMDPYSVHFPNNLQGEDFVRLNEEEAQWLITMKTAAKNG